LTYEEKASAWRAVNNYAQACEAGTLAKDPERFIGPDRYWEDWLTPAAATPAAATPPVATTPAPATTRATTGTATLDWVPPTQTTDGSVLNDLSGYYVYYGPDVAHLNQRVQLSNPGLTAYVIDGLPQGSYVFAISAYNSAGIESALSNVASKTVL
jgi:hypothetical protein